MRNSRKNNSKFVPTGCLCTLMLLIFGLIYSTAYAVTIVNAEVGQATESDASVTSAVETITDETENKVEVEKKEVKKEYTIKRYTTADLRLRKSTSTKSKTLKIVPRGTKVMCYETKGKWATVKVGSKTGYMSTKYLSKSKPKESNKQYIGTYELTAYYNAYGNHTASGTWPTAGRTVAINGIPLGTRVYIEGIGERVVEDTGGMGYNVVDVFYNTYNECVQFGRKYNRKVYIIK